MTKCFDWATFHAAEAGAAAVSAATAARRIRIQPPHSAPKGYQSGESTQVNLRWRLQEAVGVDVDADADLWAPIEGREPVADDILHVEAAPGVDQQSLPMTASQHR